MIKTRRLKKLQDHLNFGQLGHKEFSFQFINHSFTNEYDENGCGTLGCAMGELPFVWPEEWGFSIWKEKFQIAFLPSLSNESSSTDLDLFYWFGIHYSMCMHLFYPMQQHTFLYGGKNLGCNATKEEVANNIRIFRMRVLRSKCIKRFLNRKRPSFEEVLMC